MGDTTDRELLRRAAKAAGMNMVGYEGGRARIELPERDHGDGWVSGGNISWNPLTDDGDALRLAVKLKLSISHEACACCVWCSPGDESMGDESTSVQERMHAAGAERESIQDRASATRRAIVRAAAELVSKAP